MQKDTIVYKINADIRGEKSLKEKKDHVLQYVQQQIFLTTNFVETRLYIFC